MFTIAKYTIGKFQILIITFVWMLIFAMPLLFSSYNNEFNWIQITKIWSEYTFVLFIFFLNRFILLPKFLFKEKKNIYFLSIFISLLVLLAVSYYFGINEFFSPHPHKPPFEKPDFPLPPPPDLQMGLIPPFANLLILAILILGFDTGLIISVKWIQLEQNKLTLEKENITNKMEFLQNQISPHFFMNTLNNIHALVDINRNEAKDAIIKLSQLMGHMLYDSQTTKISIQKEIEFVNSYVELMKIRFTDDVAIELNLPSTLPPISIPPLLTISFIENAFKHGVSYEKNSFIRINYMFTEREMIFRIQNSIQNKPIKRKNSGIGIANTRHRLDLIYGNTYTLDIEQLPEIIYSVTLKIPL